MRSGQRLTDIFYIQKGYIRQHMLSFDGAELTTNIFGPGDVFPLTWIIDEKEDIMHKRFYETITECLLFHTKKAFFLSFLQKNPEVSYTITQQVVIRMNEILGRIAYMVLFTKARVKIVATLLLLARRFGQRDKNDIVIPFPLKHHDLATFVGLTRETVSLELKKLEKENCIVQLQHRITIKNLRVLQQEVHLEQFFNY